MRQREYKIDIYKANVKACNKACMYVERLDEVNASGRDALHVI